MKLTPIDYLGLWLPLLVAFSRASSSQILQDNPGEPLYLTPLIKAGEIERAQESALVSEFDNVTIYTGFITVNETFGSNIFFWYFPAESTHNQAVNDDDNIPLILWLNGGPGSSCIAAIFGPAGPFSPLDELNFDLNHLSWHKKYHMIYMDNPVQTGFSHAEDPNGYIYSSERAAEDIYSFLQQFFLMFPDLQSNPFYPIGVSYGGRFATELAHLIHIKNGEGVPIPINLNGVLMDSPLVEAKAQIKFADPLYGAGLINEGKRMEYLRVEEAVRSLIDEEKWVEAAEMMNYFTGVDVMETTGFPAMDNMIDEFTLGSMIDMTRFLTLNETRRILHVGSVPFERFSMDVVNNLKEDLVKSSAAKLDEILKIGYRFLLFVGNVDVGTGHLGIKRLFNEAITWEGGNELVDGEKEIFRVDESVAGYISRSGKAELVIVRNAGHGAFFHQPKWVLKALEEFLE